MRMRALVAVVGVLSVLAGGCTANKKWGKGATAGALIGAAVGGGAGVGTQYARGDDRSNQVGVGAAVGVGVGALVGALVGHLVADESAAPEVPPPPQPPAPPGAAAVPAPTQRKLVLRSILFDFDRAEIRPSDAAVLNEAVSLLSEEPTVRVQVEGHTDDIGTTEYNLVLAARRAEAVRRYLVSHAIAAERLTIRSLGESQPVASNDTEEGRAQNRRVELRVRNGQ